MSSLCETRSFCCFKTSFVTTEGFCEPWVQSVLFVVTIVVVLRLCQAVVVVLSAAGGDVLCGAAVVVVLQ